MSSGSSISYRRYNGNQDVTHKTHCDCEPPHPISVQVAWTLENPGRRFKGCSIRDKDKKCGVYGFLDLELPSDCYKHLLYDLHEENKALKRMNKISRVMEDSSKRMSNNSKNQMVKDLKAYLTFVKSKLKVYDRLLLVDVYEEDGINTSLARIIVLSSDSSTSLESTSLELSSSPSITSVPKEGPSQDLLKWYGYVTNEDTTHGYH
nr:hypothetical protein [Tanacetum cinerariifolium]GEW83268.1 hypothetical protein [Tanacetum cinerariifolium]